MNICSFLLKRERSFLKKSYYDFNELLEKEYKKKFVKRNIKLMELFIIIAP